LPDKSLTNLYHIHFNINLSLFFLIGALSSLTFMIISLLRGKRTPLLYSFWAMQILFFIEFMVNYFLYTNNWRDNWYVNALDYLFYCFISPAFLFFVFILTEHKIIEIKRNIFLIFLPAALVYILLLADPIHHLFFYISELSRRVYGPFFWLHYLTVITYQIIGIYYLLKYSIKNYAYIKRQTNIIIAAVLISLLTAMVFIFRVGRYGSLVAVCGLEVTMLMFVWATYYRFFNITPLALRRIAENMKESIIVVDNYNEINNFNNHFIIDFLSWIDIRKTDHIEVLVRKLEDVSLPGAESDLILYAIRNPVRDYVSGELTLTQPVKRTFMVAIHPVYNQRDLIGRVISFNDISDYKKLLEGYDQKNLELLALNQQLTEMNAEVLTASERLHEYAATVEELAIVKERNRMARDVHDTLGHTMTLVLTALEVSQISLRTRIDKDLEITKKYLADAIQITRKGITELRNSIRGLAQERVTSHNLRSSLEKLVADFKISGITVDFSLTGSESVLEPVQAEVIYRICQESLTNSFRHGKAREVSIILRIGNGLIKLYIYDNGSGCKDIKPGYGLSGMKQRVEDLRGRISFGSDGERGFAIHAEIPLNLSLPSQSE
jgi:signal transduction histidine kinase